MDLAEQDVQVNLDDGTSTALRQAVIEGNKDETASRMTRQSVASLGSRKSELSRFTNKTYV